MKLRRLASWTLAACLVTAITTAYAVAQPDAAAASTNRTRSRGTTAHAAAKHRAPAIRKAAALTLGLGNGSLNLMTSGSSSSEATWEKRAKTEGVQTVRVVADWGSLAPVEPTDPSDPGSSGYDWTALDQQVKKFAADGFKIIVVVDDAPWWAEGADMPTWAAPGTWKPNDADLQAFAQALATRYNGRYVPAGASQALPKLSYWEAWNEPNLSSSLSPQRSVEDNSCGSASRGAVESTALYRGMLNAFYAGIHGVSSSEHVLMAGLAPYSHPNCKMITGAATYRVSPVAFMQGVFCLNASDKREQGCNAVTHLNAINAHPYPPPDSHVGATWSAPSGDTAMANVGRLSTVLRAAERAKTVSPRTNIGFYVTELGWDTDPPDRGGATDATAAKWMSQGFYLLWQQGVRTILWYRLGDIPDFQGESWPGASGLYTSNGKAKPMATAFRFLFVTHRTGRKTVQAWGRTPVAGTLKIERKSGRRWKTVKSGHVSAHEVFEATLSQRGSATFRAQVGRQTSLTWRQTGGKW